MAARPYPYERWPRVSRRDADCMRSALRALPSAEACARAAAEAAAVLGAQLSARKSGCEIWPAAGARAELGPVLCALWLERAEGVRTLPIVCEVPRDFTAMLVDRALGGDGTAAQPIGAALDDVSCGVLAYLTARVCAALDAGVRVRAVLTEAARAHALLGDERVLVIGLDVTCQGGARGRVRLWMTAAAAGQLTPAHAAPRARLHDPWRTLPIALCAHAGSATLARREWEGLNRGDVVVLDRCSLARTDRGFEGAIELHPIGSRRRRLCGVARDQRICIESLHTNEDTPMTEGKRIDTQAIDSGNSGATALAADTPIEVCLEIARFTLPLDELSALREGEVLDTGSAIGSRVSLSAGGRPIARGELVDVEGAIGVRILELLR